MKLTIVIPVFNASKTVERCVDSIFNQSRNNFTLEIIICNDGSTDTSQEKLVLLEKKYNNIKLFLLPNRGVSIARNFAMKQAMGDYIWFIDSDDFIHTNSFTEIEKTLNKYSDLEVINFGYSEENELNELKLMLPKSSNKLIDGFSFLENNDGRLYLWNNIYKTSFITKNKFYFFDDLVVLEDSIFNINVFTKAKKIAFINKALYTYCFNKGSISKKRTITHLLKLGESSKKAHLRLQSIKIQHQNNTKEYNILNKKLEKSILGFFYSLLRYNYSIPFVKDVFVLYEKNKLLPLKIKPKSVALFFFKVMINSKYVFLMLCFFNAKRQKKSY